MSGAQIPFGRRPDGRLVEVGQVERGLACNCICPGCGERLLAKKGEVKVQHFAHLSGSACATGAETALHLAAKQLIADERWLALPPLRVEVARLDFEFGWYRPNQVYGRGQRWTFDRVALELAVGEIRPDVVGFIGEAPHAVEILVTHQVDAEKRSVFGRLSLPSIEIDLSKMVGKIFTFDALSAAVQASVDNKKWLYHPQKVQWEAELLAGFADWRSAHALVVASRRDHAVRPRIAKPDPEEARRVANERYRRSTTEAKWHRLERELGVPREEFPRHLGVEMRESAGIVQAEDALWQGALFAKFVLGEGVENRQGRRLPSDRAMSEWLAQRFGAKGGEGAARPVVRRYLSHLHECGFLRKQGLDFFVEHSDLQPPARTPPVPGHHLTSRPEPALPWKRVWPDYDRLVQWAAEMSPRCGHFDAEQFVRWLSSLDAPPSLGETTRVFCQLNGNPDELMTALHGIGVVERTWRVFSFGEPAPWLDE